MLVSSCEFCSTFNDFALYAFAGPFLSYIREIGLVGLVTLKGTRHERYRTFGVGVLIASILAEGYLINTAHIQIPQNDAAIAAAKSFWAPNGVFMLHDNLYLLRQLVFLLLPSVIHFLLPPSPSPFAFAATPVNANNSATPSPVPIPQTPHAAALLTLQALVPKLQLLRYTRGAVMRSPSLRDSATEWWSVEKQEGEWVRGDDAGVGSVREVARGLGVGFDERTKTGNANNTESAGIGERNMGREDGPGPGPLRVNARAATRNLMAMFTTGTGMGSNQGSSSTSSGNRRDSPTTLQDGLQVQDGSLSPQSQTRLIATPTTPTQHALYSSNADTTINPIANNNAIANTEFCNIYSDFDSDSTHERQHELNNSYYLPRFDSRKRKAKASACTSNYILSGNKEEDEPQRKKTRKTLTTRDTTGKPFDVYMDIPTEEDGDGPSRRRKVERQSELNRTTREVNTASRSGFVRGRGRGKGSKHKNTVLRDKVVNGVGIRHPQQDRSGRNIATVSICTRTPSPTYPAGPGPRPFPFAEESESESLFTPEVWGFTRSGAPTPSPAPTSILVEAHCLGSPFRCDTPGQGSEDDEDFSTRPIEYASPVSTPRATSSWASRLFVSPWSAAPSTPCPAGPDAVDVTPLARETLSTTPNVFGPTSTSTSSSEVEICTIPRITVSFSSPVQSSEKNYHDDDDDDEVSQLFGGHTYSSPHSYNADPNPIHTPGLFLPCTNPNPNEKRRKSSRSQLLLDKSDDNRPLEFSLSQPSAGAPIEDIESEVSVSVSTPMYVGTLTATPTGVECGRVGASMFMQMQLALELLEGGQSERRFHPGSGSGQETRSRSRSSEGEEEIETETETDTAGETATETSVIVVRAEGDDILYSTSRSSTSSSSSSSSSSISSSTFDSVHSLSPLPLSAPKVTETETVTPVVQPTLLPEDKDKGKDISPLFLTFPSIPSSSQLYDGVTPAYRPVSVSDSDSEGGGGEAQRLRLCPFPVSFLDYLRARLDDPFLTETETEMEMTGVGSERGSRHAHAYGRVMEEQDQEQAEPTLGLGQEGEDGAGSGSGHGHGSETGTGVLNSSDVEDEDDLGGQDNDIDVGVVDMDMGIDVDLAQALTVEDGTDSGEQPLTLPSFDGGSSSFFQEQEYYAVLLSQLSTLDWPTGSGTGTTQGKGAPEAEVSLSDFLFEVEGIDEAAVDLEVDGDGDGSTGSALFSTFNNTEIDGILGRPGPGHVHIVVTPPTLEATTANSKSKSKSKSEMDSDSDFFAVAAGIRRALDRVLEQLAELDRDMARLMQEIEIEMTEVEIEPLV
ncbi:hypothetical protein D9758_008245 [Tetrapyrgos nigripes]|uniref:Uncharacterized protein n=1 Tax=Tetrapyrgos nigripes TaxID=182062 RepID=A0A8H5G1E3_9AGAR|nr:hypothetical protein D9758_008245 [Tetrapyrgos nigripes]